MAELKTRETDASVDDFLQTVDDETKRADCKALCELMSEVTGAPARMWGTAIVGFGHHGDWFEVGFSPRKRNLVLYVMPGFSGFEALLERLGPHKTGKSCLYLNRLTDVNPTALRELVVRSVALRR